MSGPGDKVSAVPGQGLSSVQELYDMINGKSTTNSGGTTTQDGGTTTKTESAGISQEGMNAMLQSALSNTNGLAAISQGQRTAGGYGSSVNTMLTNDLLTRTASQIAQNNMSKTTQTANPNTRTTTPQTTQTVGGATVAGTTKAAAFLTALQGLNKSGAPEWLKQKFGLGGEAAAGNADTVGAALGANISSPSFGDTGGVAEANNALGSLTASTNSYGGGDAGSMDFSSYLGDASISPDTASNWEIPAAPVDTSGGSGGGNEWTVADPSVMPDPVVEASAPDLTNWSDQSYADGGRVSKQGAHAMVQSYADGGAVLAKKPSVLGTSQYNEIVDTTAGAAGSVGTSVNAPISQATQSSVGKSAPTPSGANSFAGVINSLSGASNDAGGAGIGAIGGAIGDTGVSMGQVGAALGAIGAVSGNSAIGMAGQAAGIAGSANPGAAFGMAAANAATNGIAGMAMGVANAVSNPSVSNAVDAAVAAVSMSNPAIGIASLGLNALGLASIGTIAQNAMNMANPNNPVSPAMQASVNAAEAADALGMGGADSATDASSAGAVNGSDAMSDGFGFGSVGSGGFGGDGGGFGAAGMGDAGPGGSSGDGGASGAGPGDGGSDGGSSGGDSGGSGDGGGGGDGWADGGHITGPGSGISDSIPTNLSDGEFVLSADTVAAIGLDKLQALQDKYHVPAAVQKLQSYAKRG